MFPDLKKQAAALLAVVCLVLAGQPAIGAVDRGGAQRVGDVRAKAMKVRIDKASGKQGWKAVTKQTKVVLKAKNGDRTRGDLNDLARGAKVLRKVTRDGRLARVVLAEKSTGNADCSFDSDEESGDDVTNDDSFDCSTDYDDGEVDTDSDCSYDASSDGPANDWSMDASWDCSYSETDDEDDSALDWDCSYSASAGGSHEPDGGDVDADLDFDCSWSGAAQGTKLWECGFLPGVLGFRCVSVELGQEFSYVIDPETMQFEGGMDFSKDLVSVPTGDSGMTCEGSAADGYDCEYDGESESGACEADWDMDSSREGDEGDVSGSLSYSCSWDA